MLKKIDENLMLFSTQFVRQKEFWSEKFSGEMSKTSLVNLTYQQHQPDGGTLQILLPQPLSERLMKLSKQSDLSLYILLLTSLKILLYRYYENEEINVLSPLYQNNLRIPGALLNDRVLIRDQINNNLTFKECVLNITRSVLEAYENQDYPFDKLMEYLFEKTPSEDTDNFSSILCSLENIHGDLQVHHFKTKGVLFSFKREQNNISCTVHYNTDEFEQSFIHQVGKHLMQVVEQTSQDVNVKIPDISLLTAEEKHRLIYRFNSNQQDIPGHHTLVTLLRQQTLRQPHRIAAVYNNQALSYSTLDEKSKQLAGYLFRNNMQCEQPVGILMERTPLMLIAILAIWKANGAHLPIEPDEPLKRKIFFLKDSGAKLLISTSAYIDRELEKAFKGKIIKLDLEKDDIKVNRGGAPTLNSNLRQLAYIIYTSGSTGKPKGALVEHLGMLNHMYAKVSELQITEESIIAQNSPHSFDISVWQFFCALTMGGKTVIYSNQLILNVDRFIERVIANHITHLELVPTYLSVLLDFLELNPRQFKTLKHLIVTGEAVKPMLVRRWFRQFPGIGMVNAYGPTEASDDITHYIMEKTPTTNRIYIGSTVQNLNIYIVNRQMELCPIGVKGEILVSGIGVGRGYLNNPEKTGEVFTEDPFIDEKGVRLYKTCDLGCWQPDGNIDFFGRKDHQVKIRGYRIELGEIESTLLKHEAVKDAAVIDNTNENGDRYLCCYWVPANSGRTALETVELKEYLYGQLPEYLVPSYFKKLDALPLTANGKINRKALPDPEWTGDLAHYQEPRNEFETKIVEIWADVLGIEKNNISIENNFFELGGDSIKAIQIAARMQKYGLSVNVRDLFQNSTIEQLAKSVKKITQVIDQAVVQGEIELTPIQHWFFHNNLSHNHHFNQSIMISRQQGFDEEKIKIIFTKLVEHHDALRMVYQWNGNRISQVNQGLDSNLFDLEVFNLNGKNDIEEKIEAESNRIQGGIDLKKGPLVKLGLYKTHLGDYLLIVIHHLVIDGVSWRILLEDFALGYHQLLSGNKIKFQNKTHSYKYWAEKLVEYSSSNELQEELEFWKKIENSKPGNLPKDYQVDIKMKKIKYIETIHLELDETSTEQLLKEVNQVYNTNINDILLTALAMAIREWAGMQQLAIKLEGHGREDIFKDVNITRTIGWFTSIYPVLFDMSPLSHLSDNEPDHTRQYIKLIKETLRRIPNNGLGYGIIRFLMPKEKKKDLLFTLEPEICFNYLGHVARESSEEIDIFNISELSMGNQDNPESENLYSLDINGVVTGGKFKLAINYNKNEYKKTSIEKLADGYKAHLKKIIHHCVTKEESEPTLSDFTTSDINENELELIFDQLEENF